MVRLSDRESGLSARTIARRLSSVSGLYAYLVARGDTPVPVPSISGSAPRIAAMVVIMIGRKRNRQASRIAASADTPTARR